MFGGNTLDKQSSHGEEKSKVDITKATTGAGDTAASLFNQIGAYFIRTDINH